MDYITREVRCLKRYLVIVIIGTALLVAVLALSSPRGPETTTMVVIDERITAFNWRAHSYPNDQYDPGLQFILASRVPLDVKIGQIVMVTGTVNWRSTPARYNLATVETEVPPFTPGYVDVPITRHTQSIAVPLQTSGPSDNHGVGSGTTIAVGASSRPGAGIYDTSRTVTFIQPISTTEWLTRERDGESEVVVRFDFDEQGREMHDRRWKGYGIKGATLIVKGEAAGYDEEGRPIIRVWIDSTMRSLNTP